jgi:hypothetical protein
MRRFGSMSVLALCLLTAWSASPAQTQEGALARIVVIEPKTGHAEEFEAGYKKHLEWHRANRDPWQWHGWTFVLGQRLGKFMDGTFGHTAAALDAAVKPAEDAADNRRNVTPYADFLSHGVYERLTSLTRGAPLPDTSPLLVLNTYTVIAGQEVTFERALLRLAETNGIARFTCYKLRLGGTGSEYILMRAANSFGTAVAAPLLELPTGVVLHSNSELLRYDAAMSYEP